jgi:hypothetical protein
VHFHLVLADLGAVVAALAHQIGCGKALLDTAELEQHVALEIAGLVLMQRDRIRRQRGLGSVISRQFAHLELNAAQGLARGGVVDGGDGRHRLAAIAHAVVRQRMLAACDRQHAESLVAVGAGDDSLHARKLERLGNIDFDDFAVRIGAAVDAPGQLAGLDDVGSVFGAAGDFFRPVDHRHIAADVVRRNDLVHGDTPCALSVAAYCTASMIFT